MYKIETQYFDWLCDKVLSDNLNMKYYKLMDRLHNFDFVPLLRMDENREHDGKQLRYRFGLENDIPRSVINQSLDTRDIASVLEMMIALSIRCEETIMTDDDYGDRTGNWFWNMIVSLGLGIMNDSRFDDNYVSLVLDDFVNRQYKRNGEGGLFTIDGINRDMRNVEIWYQMCWYLDSL